MSTLCKQGLCVCDAERVCVLEREIRMIKNQGVRMRKKKKMEKKKKRKKSQTVRRFSEGLISIPNPGVKTHCLTKLEC